MSWHVYSVYFFLSLYQFLIAPAPAPVPAPAPAPAPDYLTPNTEPLFDGLPRALQLGPWVVGGIVASTHSTELRNVQLGAVHSNVVEQEPSDDYMII